MRESASNVEKSHVRYLTPEQVHRLTDAASDRGRHGQRDSLIIMLSYRHGLRVSELCDLKWSDFDFEASGGAELRVRRLKGSIDSTHYLDTDETRKVRAWRKRQGPGSNFLFLSERGDPLDRKTVWRIVKLAGENATIEGCHPHRLRHAAGHMLTEAGASLQIVAKHLGHANMANTQRYAQASSVVLKDWRVR